MQGYTSEGDSYAIVMQEGIGSKYKETDRASEDHVNINGKVYKLDQSNFHFEYDEKKAKETGEHKWTLTIETTQNSKIFEENYCKLTFNSALNINEGVNLVFLAQRRYLELGYYDIDCEIEGKKIQEKGVQGMFEHLWIRW